MDLIDVAIYNMSHSEESRDRVRNWLRNFDEGKIDK